MEHCLSRPCDADHMKLDNESVTNRGKKSLISLMFDWAVWKGAPVDEMCSVSGNEFEKIALVQKLFNVLSNWTNLPLMLWKHLRVWLRLHQFLLWYPFRVHVHFHIWRIRQSVVWIFLISSFKIKYLRIRSVKVTESYIYRIFNHIFCVL